MPIPNTLPLALLTPQTVPYCIIKAHPPFAVTHISQAYTDLTGYTPSDILPQKRGDGSGPAEVADIRLGILMCKETCKEHLGYFIEQGLKRKFPCHTVLWCRGKEIDKGKERARLGTGTKTVKDGDAVYEEEEGAEGYSSSSSSDEEGNKFLNYVVGLPLGRGGDKGHDREIGKPGKQRKTEREGIEYFMLVMRNLGGQC